MLKWAWDNWPPVVFIIFIIGGTIASLHFRQTVEDEARRLAKLCQTNCFPFAARGDCECANDQGNWVPQERKER